MDLIPVKIKKHVRSNFAGKYDSKQLEFLTSIVSAGKPRISPVLSNGIFGYLQKHGLIEVKASLTEKGRWVATAYSLHISFFTLSALADFYCMQKATGFAVSPKFMERFELYYSSKYLTNTISTLAQKGFIYRTQKNIWKIRPLIFKNLKKQYDCELVSLKNWLDKTQDAADESIMENLDMRKNAIKNAFFTEISVYGKSPKKFS